jgi:hypothetical protein
MTVEIQEAEPLDPCVLNRLVDLVSQCHVMAHP